MLGAATRIMPGDVVGSNRSRRRRLGGAAWHHHHAPHPNLAGVARAACFLASPLVFLTIMLLLVGPIISLVWALRIMGDSRAGNAACCTEISSNMYPEPATAADQDRGCSQQLQDLFGVFTFTRAIISEALAWDFSEAGPNVSNGSTSQVNPKEHTLAGLLPWFGSLVLGIVAPCVFFLMAQYQIWRGELRLEDDFLGDFPWQWSGGIIGSGSGVANSRALQLQSSERTRETVVQRMANYTRKVANGDVIQDISSKNMPSSCCSEIGETCDCHKSAILVPKPGRTLAEEGAMREAPNLCAICLGDFQTGEDIIWSSNDTCCHVFHTSCALPWLARSHLCPCCRQTFLPK